MDSIQTGISPITAEMARQNLPLDGHLSYFMECLTQDQWVLDGIGGLHLESSLVPRPYPQEEEGEGLVAFELFLGLPG